MKGLFLLITLLVICSAWAQTDSNLISTTNQKNLTNLIDWIVAHKEDRPDQVILIKKTEIPIVIDGKRIGTATKPIGSSFHLDDLNKNEIVSLVNGVSISIPIENTNLLDLAQKAFEKSQKNISLTQDREKQQILIAETIKEKLTHSPISSDELMELYSKHSNELLPILEHQDINLTGLVTRVVVSGLENDRADITLSQNKFKKISIFCDLKSTHHLVETNNSKGYHNKFDKFNDQLIFTCWKGNDYKLLRPGMTRFGEKLIIDENGGTSSILVCSENSNIKPIWVHLKSNNGANLVFEAVSHI